MHLYETCFGKLIVGVLIGVVLYGQFSVNTLYFLLRSRWFYPQRFVMVFQKKQFYGKFKWLNAFISCKF